MTTIQKTKNRLISRISEIDNIFVLETIENLIIEKKEPSKLSAFQEKIIALSEADLINGEVIEHSVAMKQIAMKYGW